MFVQVDVLLIWSWPLLRTWGSFWVRLCSSQVNTLWLWLYTTWSYMIGWVERYSSSRWDWNEEHCVGGVAQGTYSYNATYHLYKIGLSFEHDDHFEFEYFWAKSTICGCDCILCGHVWLCDSNGKVRHVEIETRNSALVELLKGHICTMERITGMKLTSPSNMTIILSSSILSQVNTLWLWLYTTWSCVIVLLEWCGSSRWDWNGK